jgi:hypothetical protein
MKAHRDQDGQPIRVSEARALWRKRPLNGVLIGSMSALLLWQFVTRQLPTYLAAHAPEAALHIDPGHPAALVTLADQLLNGDSDEPQPGPVLPARENADTLAQISTVAAGIFDADRRESGHMRLLSQADRNRIRGMATAALLRDPLNDRALRLLGQIADLEGKRQDARKFMEASVRRSMRSSYAVYWLMLDSASRGDYPDCIKWADLLLRKRPAMKQFVHPLLARIFDLGDERDRHALGEVLAREPPWRGSFLNDLPAHMRSPRAAFDVLLALKRGAAPPTQTEIHNYLRFLNYKREYEFAYYVWLQSLPAESLSRVGLLVNGGFDDPPSGAIFDWTFPRDSGAIAEIVDRADAEGGRSLYLQFGTGRTELLGPRQLLRLSPGKYHLSGRLHGDVTSSRGLQWVVHCLPSRRVVGEAPPFVGSIPEWTNFAIEFEVFGDDCRVQELTIRHDARTASEKFINGDVWYDSLAIKLVAANGN